MLEWDEPICIAFYPDPSTKAALVARMRVLASPREFHLVHRGEDALPLVTHRALILVEPEDEEGTVAFFNRNREHFEDVEARLLIVLLRGGAGERALKDAPQLASFARAASFEVVVEPSPGNALAIFSEQHGIGPEEWLAQWRSGVLPDTLENNHTLSDALVLVRRP